MTTVNNPAHVFIKIFNYHGNERKRFDNNKHFITFHLHYAKTRTRSNCTQIGRWEIAFQRPCIHDKKYVFFWAILAALDREHPNVFREVSHLNARHCVKFCPDQFRIAGVIQKTDFGSSQYMQKLCSGIQVTICSQLTAGCCPFWPFSVVNGGSHSFILSARSLSRMISRLCVTLSVIASCDKLWQILLLSMS